MKFHLVDGGTILRSVEAASLPEARFRLAPIAKGLSVVSAEALRHTLHTPTTPAPLGVTYDTSENVALRDAILAAQGLCLTDRQIAVAVGVTTARVCQVRTRLGVPSFWVRLEAETQRLLREGVSEVQIAERLGRARQYVAVVRKRSGIPKPPRRPRRESLIARGIERRRAKRLAKESVV